MRTGLRVAAAVCGFLLALVDARAETDVFSEKRSAIAAVLASAQYTKDAAVKELDDIAWAQKRTIAGQQQTIATLTQKIATLEITVARGRRAERSNQAMLAERAELMRAREQLVAELGRRNSEYRRAITALRAQVEPIADDPERRAELDAYNAGHRRKALQALRVIEDRRHADRKAGYERRLDVEYAAEIRQTAALWNAAIGSDGITTADVAREYERVVALDSTFDDWSNLADARIRMSDLDGARTAAENMVRTAETPQQQMRASSLMGSIFNSKRNFRAALDWQLKALAQAERLAVDHPDTETLRDLYIVRLFAGRLYAAMRDPRKALTTYASAAEALGRAAETPGAFDDHERQLAVVLIDIGQEQTKLGDVDEALDKFERAATILDALRAKEPRNAMLVRDATFAARLVGNVHATRRETGKALDAYEKALSLAAPLVQSDPSNGLVRADVYWIVKALQVLQCDVSHADRLLAAYGRAQRTIGLWLDADGRDLAAATALVEIQMGIGEARREQGSDAARISAYEEAARMGERLIRIAPDDANVNSVLLRAHTALFVAYRTDDRAKSDASRQRASAIVKIARERDIRLDVEAWNQWETLNGMVD